MRGEMPLECVGTNIADVCSVQSDLRSDPSAIEHVLVCRADIIAVVLQAVSNSQCQAKIDVRISGGGDARKTTLVPAVQAR